MSRQTQMKTFKRPAFQRGEKFEDHTISIGTPKDHEEAKSLVAVTHGEIFWTDNDENELFVQGDTLYMRRTTKTGSIYYYRRYESEEVAKQSLQAILTAREEEIVNAQG